MHGANNNVSVTALKIVYMCMDNYSAVSCAANTFDHMTGSFLPLVFIHCTSVSTANFLIQIISCIPEIQQLDTVLTQYLRTYCPFPYLFVGLELSIQIIAIYWCPRQTFHDDYAYLLQLMLC